MTDRETSRDRARRASRVFGRAYQQWIEATAALERARQELYVAQLEAIAMQLADTIRAARITDTDTPKEATHEPPG